MSLTAGHGKMVAKSIAGESEASNNLNIYTLKFWPPAVPLEKDEFSKASSTL
jgi:hypothetical protein